MNEMRLPLRLLALAATLTGLVLSVGVRADSWMPPEVETYFSADGRARLTVTPRGVDDPLQYFEDKERGREPAGQRPGSAPTRAAGRLELRGEDGSWNMLWERPLLNEVAPVSALVSNDGAYVVTFDNWHSIGVGSNVVVIYGAEGDAVRSFRLDEVVPAYMTDAFATSVSSRYWHGQGTRIEGGQLRLAIVEPGSDLLTSARAFYVDIDLATGSVAPIGDADLARWRPRACEEHRRVVAEVQRYVESERADLTAPTSSDPEAWESYGYQVARRLYWPNIPLVISLPTPRKDMYAMHLTSFRHFLVAPAEEPGDRRVFVGDLQDRLVTEVERAAAGLRPAQLTGVEMTFVADAAHWPRIAAALAASGASLRQVDPAAPLPQQARLIAELPTPPTVDPACAAW